MKINKKQLIHIIGIGGIGMSGIAEILNGLGYSVQGSDLSLNSNILRLRAKKIKVFIAHSKKNLKNVNLVIYSSAIKKNNVELKFAKSNSIPSIPRSNILAQLVSLKKTIAVSGSHGKTTTTSLIASVLSKSNYRPTIINGGIINEYGTNTRLGSGKWMVVEADESDSTFLKLSSTISIITNIDEEHLDYYKSFSNLKKSFSKFITQVPFYGCAIVCGDNEHIRMIISNISTTKIIKYGFSSKNDVRATNIRTKDNKTIFDIFIKDDNKKIKKYKNFSIPLVGKYNVLNSLATIAVTSHIGLKISKIQKAITLFKGVDRRLTHVGTVKNIEIIDDYAHHPTEIKNVLLGMKESRPSHNLIAVFQPHRFSRIVSLKKQFSAAFSSTDHVIVSEVYSAGEKKPSNFKLDELIKDIASKSKTNSSIYVDNNSILNLIEQLNGKTSVIFLGAGSVTRWAYDFYSMLKRAYE
tara:strand:+ start:4234 stop:5634 length:1401 start_codon:yes stop_codon:yes gene_type:complete